MWIVLLITLTFSGCAEAQKPYWTPERRAEARSLNTLGQALTRAGTPIPPGPFLFPPYDPVLHSTSFTCASNSLGMYTTTTCY